MWIWIVGNTSEFETGTAAPPKCCRYTSVLNAGTDATGSTANQTWLALVPKQLFREIYQCGCLHI